MSKVKELIMAQLSGADALRLRGWKPGDASIDFVVRMTPELAQALLDGQMVNRTVSEEDVARYVRDMRAGEWRVTNQSLGLSADWVLFDGQHRCWAVVLFGEPVTMKVTYGLADADRMAIDRGRTRRTADMLQMLCGVERARDLTAWANATTAMLHGRRAPLAYHDTLAWRDANAEGVAWAMALTKGRRRSRRTFAPVVAAFIFAYKRSPAAVVEFANHFVENTNMTAGEPLHTLAKYIDETSEVRDGPGAAMLKTLTALLHFERGAALGKLQIGEAGLRHYIASHTAKSLPPKPESATLKSQDDKRALLDAAREAKTVAGLVDALVELGKPLDEIEEWCAKRIKLLPMLATKVPGEARRQIARVVATRAADVQAHTHAEDAL